jgi:hypothetical protein
VGWNFGCAIITFDFHTAVETLLEPERRQYVTSMDTPEEAQSKSLIDAGTVALEALGLTSVPDDAPIEFADATSRDFDNYAVGVLNGKTILVGQRFGLDQDFETLKTAYSRISAEHGEVFAFWCNDASDTYMISVFHNGTRIRFWGAGPGIDENHGERLPCEPESKVHGHDHIMAMLVSFAGCPFGDLLRLPMERFSSM